MSTLGRFAALSILVCGCGGNADDAVFAGGGPDDAFQAVVDRGKAWLSRESVPGMTIAVVDDGKLRYVQALGVTRYGGTTPVTVDTRFAWSSITKMHTAAAAMRLVEQGKLDLDAPVTRLVPELVLDRADASKLTTRQLLDHTSGLPTSLQDWTKACPTPLGELWGTLRLPLLSEPGELFVYNDFTAFSLAGLVVERAAGKPLERAMNELVFQPSGMTRATLDPQVARAAEHTSGTRWNGGTPLPVDIDPARKTCPIELGPGGMYATATDVARTIELHLADGGGVWSKDSEAAMRDQVDTLATPDGKSRYGLGLYQSVYHGVPVLHAWGWGDHRSQVVIAPTLRWGIAVGTNADWGDPGEIAWAALDLFFPDLPDTSPDLSTPSSTWLHYTGTYTDSKVLGSVSVELVNGKLRLDVGYETPLDLVQIGGDHFQAIEASGARFDVQFGPRHCALGHASWLATSATPQSSTWPLTPSSVARRTTDGC